VADLENPSAAMQIGSALNRHLGVAWVPDGRVVFSSFETGNAEIWIADVHGSQRKQLTADDAVDRDPVASPDGRWVYFASNRGGAFNIWRVSVEGGDATRITDVADAEYPSITPDGRWICFQELINGVPAISHVPAEGGASVRLSADYYYWPCVSPDGKWIACNLREPGTGRWQAAVIPIGGGEPVARFDVPLLVMPRLQWQRLRWTPDSRAVTFIDDNGGHHDVWAQPIDGGERHPITTFRADRIFTSDIARDGAVVLARGPVSSDVVLVTGL
jgi:Tol biopolymer transport system component